MTSMWFDDLNLLLADATEEAAALAADGYFFEIAGKDDGTELSNAEAIVSSVTSDLFDGSSHEVTGWESASLPLRVQVVSPTPSGLAAGAARLIATCRKPGIRPLSFALQESAPTSVFDVLVATWKHEFDDLDSQQRQRCTYTLTLRAKPFARSEIPVSLPGLAVGGAYSETVVATGASTTGWSTTSRYVTRRNLMKNPSFENGTSFAPWKVSTGTLASPAPVVIADVGAPQGADVLKVTAGALAANARSHMLAEDITVTPGQSYPILTRIKAGHSSQTLAGVLVRWYDGSGNLIGADDFNNVAANTSTYATISLSKVAPTGATKLRVYAYTQVNATAPSGRVWYLDASAAIDLETVATTTYFDGDTADSGGLWYHWGSSQGTSGTSIETALGGVTASGGVVFPRGSSSTVPVVNVPGVGINLTFTGSVNVSAHRYIRVKAKQDVSLAVDGIRASQVAADYRGSYRTFFFSVPDSIVTSAAALTVDSNTADWAESRIDVSEIATVSSLTAGTGRAISRSVSLVGSMPAEATIKVTNNGNALGDHLIIHSGSKVGGFLRLRSYRTAGSTQTVNAATVSGFHSDMAEVGTAQGPDIFQVPVDVLPAATYLLTAHLVGSALTVGTSYTFTYQASIIEDPSGTPVEHSVVTGTGHFKAEATSHPRFPLDLGLLNLPTTDIATTGTNSAVVQIKLWGPPAGTDFWTLDEVWLADVDNGQVSAIDLAKAGLSGKVSMLEIIPASADRPQQQYLAYSGTAPNQTVREVIPTGWSSHRFDPADGDAHVTVINTATTPGLSVAIEFYPRWDVYAAPIITDTEA